MKKSILVISIPGFVFYFLSCHSPNVNTPQQTDSSGKPVIINPANNIPEYSTGRFRCRMVSALCKNGTGVTSAAEGYERPVLTVKSGWWY